MPVAYTSGFSPRPKLSFGLALPTGCESLAEYLDVEASSNRSPADEISRTSRGSVPSRHRDHGGSAELEDGVARSAGRHVLRLGDRSPGRRPPGAREHRGGCGAGGVKPPRAPRAQRARGGRRPAPSGARARRSAATSQADAARSRAELEHPSPRCATFGAWAGSRDRPRPRRAGPINGSRAKAPAYGASRAGRSSASIAASERAS